MAITLVSRGVALSGVTSDQTSAIPNGVQAGDLFVGFLAIERENTADPRIRFGGTSNFPSRQGVASAGGRSSTYLYLKTVLSADITNGTIGVTNSGDEIARNGWHFHHSYFTGDIPTNLNNIDINNFSAPPQDIGTDATNSLTSSDITASGTTIPTTWNTENYSLGSVFIGAWHHRRINGGEYSLSPSTGWTLTERERSNKCSSGVIAFIAPSSGSLGSYTASITQNNPDQNSSLVFGIPLSAAQPITYTKTVTATAASFTAQDPIVATEYIKNPHLSVVTQLFLMAQTPAVQVDPGKSVTATAASATAGTPVVQIDPSRSVTATAASATAGTPVVQIDPSRSVTATAVSATAGTPAVQVDLSKSVTATAASATAGTPVVQIDPSRSVTATAVSATAGTPAVQVDPGRSVTATAATATAGTPVVQVDLSRSVTATAATATAGTPVVQIDPGKVPIATAATFTASAIGSISSQVISKNLTATAATAAAQTPTVQIDPSRSVTATAATATAGTPAVQVDLSRSVTATAASATAGTPAVQVDPSRSVTATAVSATAGIPAVQVDPGRSVTATAATVEAFVGLTYNVDVTSASISAIALDVTIVKTQFIDVSNGNTFSATSSTEYGYGYTVADLSSSAEFPSRLISTTFTAERFPEVTATVSAGIINPNVVTDAPEINVSLNVSISASPKKEISRSVTVAAMTTDAYTSYPSSQTIQISLTANTDTQTQIPINNSLNSQVSISREITKIISITSSGFAGAEITGGNIRRDIEALFSISSNVDQSSGSSFEVSADIDGIGSIGAKLSQRLITEADIDGVATIDGPLIRGVDVVTITEIWNVALVELGISTVTEVDTSPQAQLLSTVWNGGFRQQFLADHAFHGAKTTKDLSLYKDSSGNAISPSGSRWKSAYELPSDYIRALTINGLAMQPNSSMGKNAWEIEIVSDGATVPVLKRCLLSNEGSISLEYIMDIGNNNISLISPLVAHACGLSLAAHVATNFGKNPNEQAQLNQKAADALLAAKGVDGQESSPRYFSTTSLLDVRR